MVISPHISFWEATFSETAERHGISNLPNLEEISNMRKLADMVFEPLRAAIGLPIRVNSFYRSIRLNQKIGGSPTSQHCRGQAMDISSTHSSCSNADLFRFIQNNLEFDQLIWEFGTDEAPNWVHVSYVEGKNRKQVLRSISQAGKIIYQKF